MCDPAIVRLDIPILGIGYGMWLIATHFGAKVNHPAEQEYGLADFTVMSEQSAICGSSYAIGLVASEHAI